MNINLKIWRQASGENEGKLHDYRLENVDPNISFLEMLDILNNKLVKEKKDPVAFDHDCREGICGSCGFMINGRPHGPQKATTVCQLHMRSFSDEEDILLEPFRAKSFGVIKDLSVDRKSFDRIISSSGFVSVNTGEAGEANSTRPKTTNITSTKIETLRLRYLIAKTTDITKLTRHTKNN